MTIYEEDLFKTVEDIIKDKWRPKKRYSKETKYRDDMFGVLRTKIDSKYHMKKEAGRSLADIGIDEKVGIEVKYNLSRVSDSDRASGQSMRHMKNYKYGVIIVCCGKTSQTELDNLSYSAKIINRAFDDNFKKLMIITKQR